MVGESQADGRARSMKESMSRLQEVNEAEWTTIQNFLKRSQKKREKSSADDQKYGRWTGIHDRARTNDSEGLHAVIQGRRALPIQGPDTRTESGWTSLHVAAMCNSAAAAAAAIEGKADIFIKDIHGKSPLHAAAANNAVEAMTHIVATAKRNNISWVVDNEGNTPLHAAAAAGALEACRYLLNAGADPHARNKRGRTPQDVATTVRFKAANELLVNGLEAFSKFTKLQLRPRTQRLLLASKPTIGTYPVRLRPNCDLCHRRGLDFVVGAVSCQPSPEWIAALREAAFAASLRYRSAADRVKLQQAVIVAQNLYPQLAGMGLVSSTPAFRRKVHKQQLQERAQRSQRMPSAGSPGPASRLGTPVLSHQLPAIRTSSGGVPSPGMLRQGSPFAGGRQDSPFAGSQGGSVRSPFQSGRPGSKQGTSRSAGKGKQTIRMPVNEGTRKMAALLWAKSWSDPKAQSEVPALEVEVSEAEAGWREQVRATVDDLGRMEANWCVQMELEHAVGQNRLRGGRFELSPPAWRLLLEIRGKAATGEAPSESEWRAFDVDARVFEESAEATGLTPASSGIGDPQLSMQQLEELYHRLGFHAIADQEYLQRVPYPVDLQTMRRRASSGYYRSYEQVACNFVEMCMNWLSFDWTERSDTQETYRAALSMAEQGMQVLMHRKDELQEAEAAVRAEEEEAVRDSLMLQAEECARAGSESVGRPSKRMAGMNEVLGRCPALADQIMQLGEGWSVENQEVDNLENFAARLGDDAYEVNKDGAKVMLIPSKLEKIRADRLVKWLRFIATGHQKYLEEASQMFQSSRAEVWRVDEGDERGELPSLTEESAAGKEEEEGGVREGGGSEERMLQTESGEVRPEGERGGGGATPGVGGARGELLEADSAEGEREGLASRGGIGSRRGKSRGGESTLSSRSGRSGESEQTEGSVLRGADGAHLTLFKHLMPDGRPRKAWWRSLKELAVVLSSVDVKRLFVSDKEYDRYGRVRKRVIKFHPFEKPVAVTDGDDRRIEALDGVGMDELAPAGGRMLSLDMEKIHQRVDDRDYDVIEKMKLDLFVIVMYTLLNQLNERERMKRLCDPRGASYGGAEPTLLAPVMPSRVWSGELGNFGVGAKAVAWAAVHWFSSNHLGGWTHLDRVQGESRHSRDRTKSRRMSFPQIEYQISVQPLPFTLPLHNAPCQCTNHYSHTVLSTGTDVVSDHDRTTSSSTSGSRPSAALVRREDGARTCILRGLQCAHQYEIKVRAVVVKPGTLDEDGGGLMKSTWSKSVFVGTPPASPSAPRRVKPSHVTETSVVLAWGEPRLLFGCELSDCEVAYRVRRIGHVVMQTKKGKKTRAAAEMIATVKALHSGNRAVYEGAVARRGFWTESFTVGPLLPATEVECVVRGRNPAGWGEKAPPVLCCTLPAAPSPPRQVEVRVSREGGLEVRWREPAMSNSRSRVMRYFVKGEEGDEVEAKQRTLTTGVSLVAAPREWTEAVQVEEAAAVEEDARRVGQGEEDGEEGEGEEEEEEEEEEADGLPYQFERERQEMCLTQQERETGSELERSRVGTATGKRHGGSEDGSKGDALWHAWDGPREQVAMRGGWISKRVEGLGAAKTVSVSVQAVNEAGVSEWVHAEEVRTPSRKPAAPRDVRLASYSHKTMALQWQRSEEGGSEVVLYRVRYVTEGKVVSKFINGGVLGVTLLGFKPEQLVEEVSVTALNALGASEPSSPPVSCRTLAAPVSVH